MPEGHAQPNRRNVVFVLPHFEAGGVERIVLNLLTHLDRSRFAPGLVLFDRRGPLLDRLPPDVACRGLGGVPARRLPPRLAATFTAMRAEVVYGGTNAANIASLAAARMLARPPAVVASEHTPLGPYLADAKARLLRLPLMRWLYPRAAAIAVPAAQLGDDLRRILRRPALPVVALPNPVLDERPAATAAPRHPAPPGPAFLTAGRMVPEKGFDLLIAAFARVARQLPGAQLTICGDGPGRPDLERLCHRLDVADRVAMPGFVHDPIGTLGAGRVFVLSSRREGFPNVLVEALAAGMPIVATDCPVGPRLVLDDGAFGLLVPPRDADTLAEGMRRLALDDDLAGRFRRQGPQRAEPFHVRTAVNGFADLFERIAERRDAGDGGGKRSPAAAATRRRKGAMARLTAVVVAATLLVAAPPPATAADASESGYELAAGDRIAVTAFGRSDVNGEFQIGPDGMVRLPLIGATPAAGRAIDALERDVKARLSQLLDYEAPVTVSVASYRPVFVVGDVSSPGELPFSPGMKVLHAYANAGGTPSLRRLPQSLASRVADTQHELQMARNDLTAALIRGAALDAALAGDVTLTLPSELGPRAQAPTVSRLVAREEAILAQERAALDQELANIAEERAHLDNEIEALKGQILALGAQVETIEAELEKIEGLASRGLATSSRLLDLRRIVAGTKSERHDATAYLSRARRQIVDLERQAQVLRNERQRDLLRERLRIEVETEQARARVAGARQALAALSEASPNEVVEGGGDVTFLIVRVEDGAATTIAAGKSSPLRPGDVVEVKVAPDGGAGRRPTAMRDPQGGQPLDTWTLR